MAKRKGASRTAYPTVTWGVRLPGPLDQRLREVGEARGLDTKTAIVVEATTAWLRRSTPSGDEAAERVRRRELAGELTAVGDAAGKISFQLQGLGRNYNQAVRFMQAYKELPTDITTSNEALGEALDGVAEELALLRKSVDALMKRG
ncbi:hypothetical protein WKY82_12820 [Gordonia malaquae]|uniref:hypothetical protein n=1 Tax=Gordonia malaquae TaxID=410332 RepID=UPI0030C78BE4